MSRLGMYMSGQVVWFISRGFWGREVFARDSLPLRRPKDFAWDPMRAGPRTEGLWSGVNDLGVRGYLLGCRGTCEKKHCRRVVYGAGQKFLSGQQSRDTKMMAFTIFIHMS